MRLKHQGFTLIELMIVVSIIAILAAIALPAYQDYTIRSQVAEGQMISSGARLFIRDYYADRGSWPADNAAIGISNTISGTYVSSVENINGVIRITYGNNASSKILGSTLGLGAVINVNGEIAWICGNRAITSGFTESVAGGAAGATTLIPKYLASSCR